MTETGSDLIQRLRAEREKALAPKVLTLEVPGWSGLLHVRYRPIAWDTILDLLGRAEATIAVASLNANTDALIEACDALLVKNDEGELIPLADELRAQGEDVHGDVRFDERAADALGLDAPTARATVLGVFGGCVSPELAVSDHAMRLGAWMRSTGEEVDASLLGE